MATTENTTQPLPDTPFYRAMASGHEKRMGHVLVAHSAQAAGEFTRIVRTCCGES